MYPSGEDYIIIKIKSLTKVFGTNIVLNNIDLRIETGEVLTIFGPNGVGKTTLIKIMSTLVTPTSGKVVIDGFDIKEAPLEVRKRIGVISHETYLYPELTAIENLRFYGRMYSIPDMDRRIDEVLREVGLSYRKDDRVGTFSRGMKQRLSIARAILHDPPVLLLDEPYTGLDQQAAAAFDKILNTNAGESTKVLVSHDLERGVGMCDRALILSRGKIVHAASKEELDLGNYRAIYAQFIG